ncbi:MAG: hypothetical protein ACOYKE_06845 [Ferruginibacter sp.]
MLVRISFSILSLFICFQLQAQVKIGSVGTPNANAVLELDGGTNKGLLLPRLTNVQMTALSTAPDGLVVYNTTDNFLYIRKGSNWQKITDDTNNGSLTLPYTGFAATTAGLNVFKIQNSSAGNAISGEALGGGYGVYGYSSSDAGGYFTSVSGPALVTGSGNVGIGTGTPTKAGLVVNRAVSSTYGIFGGATTGVSIQANWPGIGFNEYYNSGSKFMNTGYAGKITMTPSTGEFNFYVSPATGVADGSTTVESRMSLTNNGALVLQGVDAGYIFKDRSSTNYGGWNWYALNGRANLYRYTYGGNTISVDSIGSLGVQGNVAPTAPLSFASNTGNKIDLYYTSANSRYGIGIQGSLLQLYAGSSSDQIALGYGSSTSFTESFKINNTGGSILTNPVALTTGTEMAHYFKSSNYFTGAIKSIGTGGATARLAFYSYAASLSSSLKEYMSITDNGTIYIGENITDFTKGSGYRLRVQGKVIAEEVRVSLVTNWPDYVFGGNYQLKPIDELETYIKENKHLPNIPAAENIEKEGLAIGDMQKKMMEKIEELTLYIIQLKKENDAIKQTIQSLKPAF